MTEIKDLTFDEAMTQLEEKIALLEKEENANNQELYDEAVALKEYFRHEESVLDVSFS